MSRETISDQRINEFARLGNALQELADSTFSRAVWSHGNELHLEVA